MAGFYAISETRTHCRPVGPTRQPNGCISRMFIRLLYQCPCSMLIPPIPATVYAKAIPVNNYHPAILLSAFLVHTGHRPSLTRKVAA
jgi:hypothetical protein